ncbi:MAG: NCAIR mutase (PurE)-related protein [Pseudohongiellaceae bacterium]
MSAPYEQTIAALLQAVASGEVDPEAALVRLRDLPGADIGCARLDHHRVLRTGVPEVVYGEGKQPDQIVAIVQGLQGRGHPVLVTRLTAEAFAMCGERLAAHRTGESSYDPLSRTWLWSESPIPVTQSGTIVVACAGTSDLPVAEEAVRTAEALGNRVERVIDVGVAGIQRTFASLDTLRAARVIIVVAGMDGALPSVIAGLVAIPVIAVPTSVGYGANFGGIAALLTMLNSCAPGVTVVNIDNGFGAACAASLINRSDSAQPDGDARS